MKFEQKSEHETEVIGCTGQTLAVIGVIPDFAGSVQVQVVFYGSPMLFVDSLEAILAKMRELRAAKGEK